MHSTPSFEPTLPPLTGRKKVARMALVGAIVLGVSAVFTYTAGWLSPHKLTPNRFVDTFEAINGVHQGFRRNHAKGVGASGFFDPSGEGKLLSKAAIFHDGRVPVVARFALGGGMPHAADAPETVRSLALQLFLPNGEEWRTGMINIPVFPVSTPAAFHEQLIATKPDPRTGKPDPDAVSAFFARHPESARAVEVIKAQPIASDFANSTYNALNAFMLVDEHGRRTPVRWSLIPTDPFEKSAGSSPNNDSNYLFDALIARVKRGPLQWHLVMTIGHPDDPTRDASIAWPADRETFDAGTLTIDRIEAEATSPARTVNYDPLMLPNGIAASDDPILSARSAIYSPDVRRRLSEHVWPSAITPAEVRGEK